MRIMKTTTLIILMMGFMSLTAQEITLTAKLDKDTIGYEETIKVVFTVENVKNPSFSPPDFIEFENSSMAGTTSNVSIINGEMTQSMSYTYLLTHKGEGIYGIGKASVEIDGEIYESKIIEVVVVDKPTTPNKKRANRRNPFGSFPQFGDDFPSLWGPQGQPNTAPKEKGEGQPTKKKKKKKKVYKI